MNLNPFSRLWVSGLAAIGFLYAIKVSSWTFFGVVAAVALLHSLVANQTCQTSVKNASVFITGAGSGLGRALAVEAARRGARVVHISGRRVAPLQETARLVRAVNADVVVEIYELDVSKPEMVQQVADRVLQSKHGCPDILVNNAGMGSWWHVEDTSMAAGLQMTAVPYLGAFYCTRAFIQAMQKRGTGHILNLTSTVSIVPIRSALTYQVARYAMRGFSLSLAEDLREYPNIGVTLLNSAEVTGTDYFKTNANAIPWILTLPAVQAMNYDTTTTAKKTWGAVQAGVTEIILAESLWPVVWMITLLPGFAQRMMRLGNIGWRAAEKKKAQEAVAGDKKAD